MASNPHARLVRDAHCGATSALEKAAASLSQAASRYAEDFSDRAISTPQLPWTLAAAFFAALFVALGHLVYETRAPEPVRRFSWDDFVVAKKEDFAKHPSSDAVQQALESLRSQEGLRVDDMARDDAQKRIQ